MVTRCAKSPEGGRRALLTQKLMDLSAISNIRPRWRQLTRVRLVASPALALTATTRASYALWRCGKLKQYTIIGWLVVNIVSKTESKLGVEHDAIASDRSACRNIHTERSMKALMVCLTLAVVIGGALGVVSMVRHQWSLVLKLQNLST